MADSRIKSASDLISVFFDRETTSIGESYGNFRSAWKDIAGERLAGHSRPVDLKHGLLVVETEHQGWTQLLQYQQERMLEEIGRRFPELEIRGIAWRLASEPRPDPASVCAPKPGPALAPSLENAGSMGEPDSGHSLPGSERGPSPADALPPELRAAFERLKRKNEGT